MSTPRVLASLFDALVYHKACQGWTMLQHIMHGKEGKMQLCAALFSSVVRPDSALSSLTTLLSTFTP
jgi:hypothetical protein